MILCDTNIFIEIYRGNTQIASVVEQIKQSDDIVISDVVRAELFYGAKNKLELQFIHKDLNVFQTLPILPEISTKAVKLVEDYCLSHKIDFHDALIASTALFYDIKLYTLNTKDFIFIPELKLDFW
ncbi:type II toxin-antitoxin system VapC family toxin [Candidatus Symbiothrix dinenymphae]|uniref:type II toxin-antitoxin system VapC family toxin n=1 Tax=Candidatus Symbiothrix dinenymphae TaxID=467085 RepID=UPI000702A0D8|nr:type II toxin-antitoxin system VapC family toxin [Candidatus Symbiothrix dinenymphae]